MQKRYLGARSFIANIAVSSNIWKSPRTITVFNLQVGKAHLSGIRG